jgi:hypothetical protein
LGDGAFDWVRFAWYARVGHGLRRGGGAYGCKGACRRRSKKKLESVGDYIVRTWGAAMLRPYNVGGEC